MFHKIYEHKAKVFFLLLVFCSLLIIGTLMMNKISLHSDILYFQDFLNSFFLDPTLFSTWRMTPAPAYFPELALFALFRVTTQDAQTQIFLVSYTEWLLAVIGILWLYKVVNRNARFASWVLLLSVLSATSIIIISSDIWFFTYQNTIHFAAVLFPLYQLLILIRLIVSPTSNIFRLFLLVIYGGLSILGAVSTPVYLLSWFIPSSVICVWIFSLFIGSNNRDKKVGISLVFLSGLIGTAVGFVLQKALTYNSPLINRVGISRSEFESSVSAFFNAFFTALVSPNVYTRIAVFSVIASLLFVIFRSIFTGRLVVNTPKSITTQYSLAYKTDLGLAIICFAAIFSFLSSLIGSIVTAGFKDIYGFRYVTFGSYLLWFAVIFVTINWFENTSFRRKFSDIFSWLAGGLVILLSFSILTGPITPLGRLLEDKGLSAHFKDFQADPLMFSQEQICIENLQKRRIDLQAGIAQYWQVRSIRYISNRNITISPFDSSLFPFYWINSSEDFNLETHHFNWLLVEPENASPFSMTATHFRGTVPDPSQVFQCGEGYEIWYWNDNRFNEFIADKINEWSKAEWISKPQK